MANFDKSNQNLTEIKRIALADKFIDSYYDPNQTVSTAISDRFYHSPYFPNDSSTMSYKIPDDNFPRNLFNETLKNTNILDNRMEASKSNDNDYFISSGKYIKSDNQKDIARLDFENYASYEINEEVQDSNNDLSRVYLVPRGSDSNLLDGMIVIKSGIYQSAKFKFILQFSSHYSVAEPIFTFKTKIYHPLIEYNTGKLDLSYLSFEWKKFTARLDYLIHWIKDIFHEIDYLAIKDSFNQEAGILFEENFHSFDEKVRKSVEESNSTLYDNKQNESLNFKEFNAIHKKILDKLELVMKEPKLDLKDRVKIFLDSVLPTQS